jgi:hypothetical protein
MGQSLSVDAAAPWSSLALLRAEAAQPLAARDAGAVDLDDGADDFADDDDSAGLRAGGQRHLAFLCLRDLRRAAGRALHQPLCPLFVFAGLALFLCRVGLSQQVGAAALDLVGAGFGWALLLAYIVTAASVTGGFINYSNVLLWPIPAIRASPTLLAAIAILGATAIAYRDVKVSAQFMLWIEAISVTMILIVSGLIFWKHGLHLDPDQWKLKRRDTGRACGWAWCWRCSASWASRARRALARGARAAADDPARADPKRRAAGVSAPLHVYRGDGFPLSAQSFGRQSRAAALPRHASRSRLSSGR